MSEITYLMSYHILFVCQSCSSLDNKEAGQHLLADLQRLQAHQVNQANQEQLEIVGTPCLNTCKHSCSIALACSDKVSYFFGGLCPQSADDVLKLALKYCSSTNGLIQRGERPEILKTKPLAVLPPLK